MLRMQLHNIYLLDKIMHFIKKENPLLQIYFFYKFNVLEY